MADLERRLLPGSASMRDWALDLGSWAGTPELLRAAMAVERAGRARGAMLGRRRAAPAALGGQSLCHCRLNWRLAGNCWPVSNSPRALLAKREAIVNMGISGG